MENSNQIEDIKTQIEIKTRELSFIKSKLAEAKSKNHKENISIYNNLLIQINNDIDRLSKELG